MPDPQEKHCEGKELQNLHPIPIQSHFYFLGWIVVRTESQSSGILCSAGRDTETYCLLIENRKLIQTNANALKENRKPIQTNVNAFKENRKLIQTNAIALKENRKLIQTNVNAFKER